MSRGVISSNNLLKRIGFIEADTPFELTKAIHEIKNVANLISIVSHKNKLIAWLEFDRNVKLELIKNEKQGD